MNKMKYLTKCLFLLLFTFSLGACGGKKGMPWEAKGIGNILPEPDTGRFEGLLDLEDSFSAHVNDVSLDDFQEYVEKCKDNGFIVDSEETSDGYDAYNKEGCSLSLSYMAISDMYYISLYGSRVEGTFDWPTTGLATLIPVPETNIGSITIDSSSQLNVFVGETTKEKYDEYVKKCIDKGFTVGHSKGEKYYRAHNKNGDSLDIEYQGFKTMRISMYANNDSDKDSSSSNDSDKQTNTDANTETNTTGIRPEFKELMDSYEDFFDEYISFMEKYETSNDTASMLSSYTDYLSKYSDMMKKLKEVDQEKLSEEEALYYSEVTLRITQKLANVKY